jgi:bacteriorhodopsin
MERFELNIVAQGSQSIWVAVIVIALLCATVATVAIFHSRPRSTTKI